jgi:hypothetical protein
MVQVHPADVQDRDGAPALLKAVRRQFPFLEKVIGDGAYQGPKFEQVFRAIANWQLEIVKRCDGAGFKLLPNAGSSSVRSLGSIAAEDSPRISRTSHAAPSPSSSSPPYASCCAGWQDFVSHPKLSGRTLGLTCCSCHAVSESNTHVRHESMNVYLEPVGISLD